MAQTASGYLRFGTLKGLVRLAGLQFTVFNPADAPGPAVQFLIPARKKTPGRLVLM